MRGLCAGASGYRCGSLVQRYRGRAGATAGRDPRDHRVSDRCAAPGRARGCGRKWAVGIRLRCGTTVPGRFAEVLAPAIAGRRSGCLGWRTCVVGGRTVQGPEAIGPSYPTSPLSGVGALRSQSSQVTLEKSFTTSLCPNVPSVGFVPGRGAEQGLENKNIRGEMVTR